MLEYGFDENEVIKHITTLIDKDGFHKLLDTSDSSESNVPSNLVDPGFCVSKDGNGFLHVGAIVPSDALNDLNYSGYLTGTLYSGEEINSDTLHVDGESQRILDDNDDHISTVYATGSYFAEYSGDFMVMTFMFNDTEATVEFLNNEAGTPIHLAIAYKTFIVPDEYGDAFIQLHSIMPDLS